MVKKIGNDKCSLVGDVHRQMVVDEMEMALGAADDKSMVFLLCWWEHSKLSNTSNNCSWPLRAVFGQPDKLLWPTKYYIYSLTSESIVPRTCGIINKE